jgi:hypothetical protein
MYRKGRPIMRYSAPVTILDPRNFKIDNILRRPLTKATPLIFPGNLLPPIVPQGWGISESKERSLVQLSLTADGTPVAPGDSLYRPSHSTVHGIDSETGLQVTEDKFFTDDCVAVSVLKIRNPSPIHVDVRIELGWGIPSGETLLPDGRTVFVHRQAPPLDDLWQQIPESAVRVLVSAIAVAPTPEEARQNARRWLELENPTLTQIESCQHWFDTHVPLFDCSDLWIAKAWYQQWAIARNNPVSPFLRRERFPATGETDLLQRVADFARLQFEAESFDLPKMEGESEQGIGWLQTVQQDLIGLTQPNPSQLVVAPQLPPRAWTHFCLQGVPLSETGQKVTVLWDDPTDPEDHYGLGIKGLVIFFNHRVTHRQDDLSPVLLPLDSNF